MPLSTTIGHTQRYILKLPQDAKDFFCLTVKNGYSLGLHYRLLLNYIKQQNANTKHLSSHNGGEVLESAILNGLREMDYDLLTKKGNEKFGYWYRIMKRLPANETTFSIGFQNATMIERLLEIGELMILKNAGAQFLMEAHRKVEKEVTGIDAVLFVENIELNRRKLILY